MRPEFDRSYVKKEFNFFLNGKKQLEAYQKLFKIRSICKKHGYPPMALK